MPLPRNILKAAVASAAEQLAIQASRQHDMALVPEGEDFRTQIASLVEIAHIVDKLVLQFGEHVREYSPYSIDLSYFRTPLKDALEGYALHEIESAAEQCEEEQAEYAA